MSDQQSRKIEIFAIGIAAFAAVASALSAGVSAYQAVYLRDALAAPFQSNLHDRQIDLCEAIIKQYGSYTSAVFIFRAVSFSPPIDERTKFADKFFYEGAITVDDARSDVLQEAEKLRSVLATAKIYSSKDTQELIGELEHEVLFDLVSGFRSRKKVDENNSTDLLDPKSFNFFSEPASENFPPIRGICREVMLGEKRGLL